MFYDKRAWLKERSEIICEVDRYIPSDLLINCLRVFFFFFHLVHLHWVSFHQNHALCMSCVLFVQRRFLTYILKTVNLCKTLANSSIRNYKRGLRKRVSSLLTDSVTTFGYLVISLIFFLKKWLIVTNFALPRLFQNPAIT